MPGAQSELPHPLGCPQPLVCLSAHPGAAAAAACWLPAHRVLQVLLRGSAVGQSAHPCMGDYKSPSSQEGTS